ncbi:MAG: signal peptidase II [Oscillospiraceae bacterium]|nr:signal peptidase II [Oscillospiraceae bacterium]
MLIFIFSALIVIVDQLFKHWVTLTLYGGDPIVLIPGILRLVYAENPGAAFGLFSNMRWPLAGAMFVAIVALVFILKRYDRGFWGSLGLAAALGGGVGNLIDRVWSGYVVDMFEFTFVNFAIFNVADIFITLGAITFFIHFIITSGKDNQQEDAPSSDPVRSPQSIDIPIDYDDYNDDLEVYDISADTRPIPNVPDMSGMPEVPETHNHKSAKSQTYDAVEEIRDASFDGYDAFESFDLEALIDTDNLTETKILEEYDLDKMLREYGFESDED